ncbi:MAG: acetate/propionate family kinase [Burkholderiaceae bacterium]|jgi:acetate kinase
MPAPSILVLNGGSSSIRFAVLRATAQLTRVCSGTLNRIGQEDAHLHIDDVDAGLAQPAIAARDHAEAVGSLVQWLRQQGEADALVAAGHRVVHGMSHFDPERITPELLADLRRIEPVDPDHLPVEIELVEAVRGVLPDLPQVACFDTQFHRHLPRVAAQLPIPRRFEAQGLRRYGFHGLSYDFLLHELERVAGAKVARGRVILAHLGGGASLAAVRDGRCVDTTMSFTPTAGLVMGTRSGDLDPSLAAYLERSAGVSSAQFLDMVNHESGLLGVSGTSADMRELLAAEADDPHAAEAVALFCYQARKAIGSFAAALGGLDTLVFSGGIGENAPVIRARICDGLQFLGVDVDGSRTPDAHGVISSPTGRVAVHVIRTNEAHVIARAVRDLLALDAYGQESS